MEVDCKGTDAPDPVYSELHNIFYDSAVKVERDGTTTITSMPTAHVFNDQHEVREEAHKELDLLSTALRINKGHHVDIIGHTDDGMLKGANAQNYVDQMQYSLHLAYLVQRVLTTDFGLEPERVKVSGMGPFRPIATNDTPSGMSQNRRIEIRIHPESQ